jgi:DNA repair exonuclease SbcCD ATPase subunit
VIHHIDIKNYQSHVDTHLDLGPLTVIVGQSSAGKSAITRALKALTSNQSGKAFITHGEQTAQIGLTNDKGTVVLTKGKPEDSYVILEEGKDPKRYTKLGVGVPEDVSSFLGIPAKDAINFAGQFDMPYLLRDSAGEVARTLGELTNVSSIFAAARESLRLKGQSSSALKVREKDLETLSERVSRFADLAGQLSAVERAEGHQAVAEAAQLRLARLNDLLLTLQTATARTKAASDAVSAPLPDVEAALALLGQVQRLSSLTTALRDASDAKRQYTEHLESGAGLIANLDEEYNRVLHEAGTCPTCGQNTEGVHTHA